MSHRSSQVESFANFFLQVIVDIEIRDRVLSELSHLSRAFRKARQLTDVLENKRAQEVAAIFDQLSKKAGFARETAMALLALHDRGLLSNLPDCLEKIIQLRERQADAKGVILTTAGPIQKSLAQEIQLLLEKKWSIHVPLVQEVDPDLLAGFRLHREDWQYDASLRGRLHRLHSDLTQPQL